MDNGSSSQAAVAEQQADDLETANAERDLENMRDAAGTEGFDDLTQGGRRGGRRNRIARFYRNRLLRKLYRKLPRRVRRLRTRARRIQKAPGRLASRARTRLVNRFAPKLTSAASRISAGLLVLIYEGLDLKKAQFFVVFANKNNKK